MEGLENFTNLNNKKDLVYYAFLRTVRTHINKELTCASEKNGTMVKFDPTIGFSLQGMFEFGNEKEKYKLNDHFFTQNNIFKCQSTKIFNCQTDIEKFTVKGTNYYCLDENTFFYYSTYGGKKYLSVRVIKNNFRYFTRDGVSFNEFEVDILNQTIADLSNAVIAIADGSNIKFDIGDYKQIRFNPANEELDFYRVENEQRIGNGITLRGKAIQKFIDLYVMIKSVTNESSDDFPNGEVIPESQPDDDQFVQPTLAAATTTSKTESQLLSTGSKRKAKLAEIKTLKQFKASNIDNDDGGLEFPKYEF